MILGIIGKIGSGKSAAIKYIKDKYDCEVFICDDICKEMIKNGLIDYDTSTITAREFFENEEIQENCRKLIHPKVFDKIKKDIHINYDKKKLYVIETALPSDLFYEICDKVICIYNSFDKKKDLLIEHRDYSLIQTKIIYNSQKYYEKFYDKADYKIENDGSKEELYKKIDEVLDEIYIICK